MPITRVASPSVVSGGSPSRSRVVRCGPAGSPVPTLPLRDPHSFLQPVSRFCAAGPRAPLRWVPLQRSGKARGSARRKHARGLGTFHDVARPTHTLLPGGEVRGWQYTCFSASRHVGAAFPGAEDMCLPRWGAGCPGDSLASSTWCRAGPWGHSSLQSPPLCLDGGPMDGWTRVRSLTAQRGPGRLHACH